MELDLKQLQYVAWRADPSRVGTKTAWAEDHGLTLQKLRDWEKTAWFAEALNDALKEGALSHESMAEVAVALQREAATGDTSAARLYMALVDKLNPPRVAPREDRAVEQLTDAELDEAWAEARAY